MNTVVVTGAGGFIGSAIVRRLVTERSALWDGEPVDHVVAAIRPRGSLARLEAIASIPGWSVEHVDLDYESSSRDLLARVRPRAVVHTALPASFEDGVETDHRPLASLLEGIEALQRSRLVHAGSAWVLAPGTGLGEDAPLDPRSAYARHKAEQDRVLAQGHVPWINLRLFNVFGRYEKSSRLVPSLVERLHRRQPAAVSHGAQVRDFNDVDDVASAFALALAAKDDAWNAMYHIGTGRATSARELAEMVAGITGHADLIRFGAGTTQDQDLPALTSDPGLATRMLGWEVDAPLEQRVRSTVEWWLERLVSTEARLPAEESIR